MRKHLRHVLTCLPGVALLYAGAALATAPVIELEQNWDRYQRDWFHYANQGSRLIDYRLFLALEDAKNKHLLRSDRNLLRYGFIPGRRTQHNPDRLPIGLTRDGAWLGLTCAACHTNEIRYQGRRIRIEGGQAHIDLQRFLLDLEAALRVAVEQPERRRTLFARAGLDAQAGMALLEAAYRDRARENAANAAGLDYGPARLDAFGAILNKGLYLTGEPDNHNPPNGPTSYPYVWDTPQHDWVEWNGSSPNPLEGALARNIGEVIGVYGHVEPERTTLLGLRDTGYRSSVRMRTLRRIEKLVAELWSPLWPEHLLTRIDRARAERGEPLYKKYCGACHRPLERTDPGRRIVVRMSSLEAAGTDPAMARNALDYAGRSGRFAGQTRFYVAGDELGQTAPALYIVNHVMGGVISNRPLQALLAQRDARGMGHGDERHPPKYLDGALMPHGTETSAEALAAYKARPLNGIWATAPYLHNGSVPNLYELMLPAGERSTRFALDDFEFDPERVGYRGTPCKTGFEFDTTLPGNRNTGHEYGTGSDGLPALTDSERLDVIEYIKTL